MKRRKAQAGFSLIEMLVVIAIIGLLAAVVLIMINNARITARNTQRIVGLRKAFEALELYRQDHGRYPLTTGPFSRCFATSVLEECYYGQVEGEPSLAGEINNYLTGMPNMINMDGFGNSMRWLSYIDGSGANIVDFYWPYEGASGSAYCPISRAGLVWYSYSPPGYLLPEQNVYICYELHSF